MSDNKGLKQWLWKQRKAARLAYALHMGTRVLSAALSLIWIRLLVGAMGEKLNGVYLAFQNVVTLGGLGDLGMGGVVGVRGGQMLGREKHEELQQFLASARAIFLMLALTAGLGMLLLSPWLPQWLHFKPVDGAGSLPKLFAVGSVLVAGVMLSSYLSNLNYACGNVTWPVIPTFLVLQLSLLGHWLLARQGFPLWIQYLPYVAAAILGLLLTWFYVRVSNPPLARIWPVKIDWRTAATLLGASFWVYLCAMGNAIYRTTDGLVINAGFEPGTLVGYQYNYKFCEIAVFLVITASFVSMPKITQWMASSNETDQRRARVEIQRLNQFQTLLGCGAALAYLAGNNLFMKLWWLHKEHPVLPASLLLQLAFALNLTVTASGDAGIQMSLRIGDKGLRITGTIIGLTGLINVALSLLATYYGSLAGIALATVLAQSLLSLGASYFLCRHLRTPWAPWVLKGWLLPLAIISTAGWLRTFFAADSLVPFLEIAGIYVGLFLLLAWSLGINTAFIRDEWAIVRGFLKK